MSRDAVAFLLSAAGGALATGADYGPLPTPVLALNGTEEYVDAFGTSYIRYRFKVTNYAAYNDGYFESRPDLAACGDNTSASRTWLDIYDAATNSRIYEFCAFGSASDLLSPWFAELPGVVPPNIYITLTDRDPAHGSVATSATLLVFSPAAPVANPDTLTTNEDTQGTASVLANDTDVNGDTLSVTGVSSLPSHGTAFVSGNVVFYTPSANYNGTDSLSYSVFDGTYTSTATVSVTVISVPDPPNPPSGLLTDSKLNPDNVSEYVPQFSWVFTDPDQADVGSDNQTAYEVRIGTAPGTSNAWDSGKQTSLVSGAPYAGVELPPNVTYYWSVRVWDKTDLVGAYSADATFVILDIGLRLWDGTSVIRVAADHVGPGYPLRIFANGVTYGIVLVDPADASASKIRIMTGAGIKALKKM